MRNAWMLFVSLVLVVAVCTPCCAEYCVEWHCDVTVIVEDPNHDCLGSMTYVCGGEIESPTQLPDPLTAWFHLTPDSLWGSALFENVNLLNNVGNTIWVSSGADDISYNTFVNTLTDGRSNEMWGFFTIESGSSTAGTGMIGHTESNFVNDCYPDFAGMDIGRIGLRVNDAWITRTCPGIPEPGAIVSLLCGIVGMCGFASRRRKAR
jgi:hypothetical protein